MNTATIRQQLHNYLEVADDKKINALYTIIEKEIYETEFEFPQELKSELDKRYAGYKSGTAKMVTASQSKKRIEKIIKDGKRK